MMRLRLLFAVAIACLPAIAAKAHDPNLSAVRVVRGTATDTVTVALHRSRLEWAEGHGLTEEEIDQALRRRVRLRGLPPDQFPKSARLEIDSRADIVRWEFKIPHAPNSTTLTASLLPEDPLAATVFQEVVAGKVARESLLESPIGLEPTPRPARWDRWVREGLTHIAGGWDHLCFVLGLLLVAGRLRTALAAVSAFTVAHAITLAAAMLGWVRPPAPWIEALVALSIACIAAEAQFATRLRNPRLPFHALGFGLIHGFAFAGGLAGMLGTGDRLVPALAGFHVGVEIGQITVVLATAVVLGFVEKRWPSAHRVVRTGLATAIGLAGLWWLGARVGLIVRG